jgi:hypothetical protein
MLGTLQTPSHVTNILENLKKNYVLMKKDKCHYMMV